MRDGAADSADASSSSVVRVRYPDVDSMGVAHHTCFLVWAEIGRTDWLRERGVVYRDVERDGTLFPVIRADMSFQSPARYDDLVRVETTALVEGRLKVRFSYHMTDESGSTTLARGYTVHVATNRAGRPIRLPAGILSCFERTSG